MFPNHKEALSFRILTIILAFILVCWPSATNIIFDVSSVTSAVFTIWLGLLFVLGYFAKGK